MERLARSALAALETLASWESATIRAALTECFGGGQPAQSGLLQVLGLGALMPFDLASGFEALGKACTVRRLRQALNFYIANRMIG